MPGAPLEISILDFGTDYIKIAWQPGVGDFSNYLIEYSPVGPTTDGIIIKSKNDEREQMFVHLAPGTEYTFKVVQQGVNSAEETVTHYTRKEILNKFNYLLGYLYGNPVSF